MERLDGIYSMGGLVAFAVRDNLDIVALALELESMVDRRVVLNGNSLIVYIEKEDYSSPYILSKIGRNISRLEQKYYVLYLLYVKGMSKAEIARTLGLSEPTVNKYSKEKRLTSEYKERYNIEFEDKKEEHSDTEDSYLEDILKEERIQLGMNNSELRYLWGLFDNE